MNNTKLGYSDISLLQSRYGLNSRTEANPKSNINKYPLWIAPMSQLIDENNVTIFDEANLNPIVSRKVSFEKRVVLCTKFWCAFGIKELSDLSTFDFTITNYICIDVANGSMPQLYELAKKLKQQSTKPLIMCGNIANPEIIIDYMEAGIDYVRVGIGGGSQCTTSILTGVHYPPVSLIHECMMIRNDYFKKHPETTKTQIIADGGISDFGKLCKALVVGADGVMIGRMAAEILESAYTINLIHKSKPSIKAKGYEVKKYKQQDYYVIGGVYEHSFYGMSTKSAQDDYGKPTRMHAEGIHSTIEIKYDITEFVSRLDQSLRSCMSYRGCNNLTQLIGSSQYIEISHNSNNDFSSNKL